MAAKCILDSSISLPSLCSANLFNNNDLDLNRLTSLLTDTCIGVTHLNQDFLYVKTISKSYKRDFIIAEDLQFVVSQKF